jgi:hypothetical protein
MWNDSQFERNLSRVETRDERKNCSRQNRTAPDFTSWSLRALFSIPFIVFLWAELRYDVNMPNWDDYDSVLGWLNGRFIPASFAERMDYLFRQHNEHRIVFDRLVELLELHALGVVNFIYLDIFGFLGLVGLVFILYYLGKRSGLSYLASIPIPFFMLTLSQNNLISFSMASIQVYWALLFSFLSFAFVSRSFLARNLVIGFLFSVVAAFTSAGGLIGFPAVFIYYLVNRKYRLAALWFLGAAIVFWIYFVFFPYNPTAIGIASHHYALLHPFEYLQYVVMFLGNMIAASGGAFVLGSLLLFAIGFLFLRRYTRFDSWIFLASTFIIATGAADGLSRISLGMDASLSSRYTPFGAILVSLVYIAIACQQKNKKILATVTALGLGLSITSYILWFAPGITSLATTQSLMDNQLVYPVQSRAYFELHKAMDDGIFSPIARIYRDLPSSLPLHSMSLYHKGYFGNIDSLSVTGGTIHIRGWAALRKQGTPAATVIINVNGQYYPSWYNLPRPDVAKHFNHSDYLYTGYRSDIAISSNPSGVCHVSVVVVGSSRARFYVSPVKIIHCN